MGNNTPMNRRNFLRAGLVGLLAAPAQAQFGKLKPPKIPGVKLPEIDGAQFLKHTPPLTTNLADVYEAVPGFDDWQPTDAAPLTLIPRNGDGDYLTVPGLFEIVAESFCLKAGTNPPSRNKGNYGSGYLFAPLKGPKAGQIEKILNGSEDHPEIPQYQVQVLLWAIIAEHKLSECPKEIQQTAQVLLDEKDRRGLENDVLAVVPPQLRGKVYGNLPPLVRDGLEAENKMRELLAEKFADVSGGAEGLVDSVNNPGEKVSALYAQLETAAMRAGELPPATEKESVPWGRWTWHPDGFFLRILPSGYSTTTRQLYFPEKFEIRGRAIIGPDGVAHTVPGASPVADDAKILRGLYGELVGEGSDTQALKAVVARAALSAIARSKKVASVPRGSDGKTCRGGGFGSGGGGGAGMGRPGSQRLGQSRKPKDNPNIERARNAAKALKTFGSKGTKGLDLPFFMTDKLLNWQFDMANAIDSALNGEDAPNVPLPGRNEPEAVACCGMSNPYSVILPRPKLTLAKGDPPTLLAPRQKLSEALARLVEVGWDRFGAERGFTESRTEANGRKLVALRREWGVSLLAVADAGDALQAVYEKAGGSDTRFDDRSWNAYVAKLATGPTAEDKVTAKALGISDVELARFYEEKRRQATTMPEGSCVEAFRELIDSLRAMGQDYARLPAVRTDILEIQAF